MIDYSRKVKIYCTAIVRYGPIVEDGFLPAYSVDTEEEAKLLIAATCRLSAQGDNYYASELMEELTLDNLKIFSERLARLHNEQT